MVKSKATKPFTLGNLFYQYKQGKIWLNPSYQREEVWGKSQKQLLIDSVLRDIDVPKLYFRVTKEGNYQYEVVDGQQRLRAVYDYLSDVFALPDDSDPVDGHPIAGKSMKKLHMDLQMKLNDSQFDIVTMDAGYTDDDVEEIFLRLQNGTPLNAPEKRRALKGNMRLVVAKLAKHKFYKKVVGFTSKRFAFEDQTAKLLHLFIAGNITDIKPGSIKKTYLANVHITEKHPSVISIKRAMDFLVRAFKGKHSPKLKKYSVITLVYAVVELLEKYDLNNYASEFGEVFLEFEQKRISNEEMDEDKQDARLSAYTSAARADRVQDLEYRHEVIMREIVGGIPKMEIKDSTRQFSAEQRLAIYIRDKGICQDCGKKCKENEYHADHKKPFSKGGKTNILNGRVLCSSCNLKKGAKLQ